MVFRVRAGILHLVLLPELVELIAVNGKLDEMQVIALNAEVEIPKPEHEAVRGWGVRRVHEMKDPSPPPSNDSTGYP